MVEKEGTRSKVGRRIILKTAAAGATLGFVPISRTSASTENKKEIPIVVRGDEWVETREVSEDWWQRIKHVREVRQQIGADYSENPAIAKISIVRNPDELINGRETTKVKVVAHRGQLSLVDQLIPEKVDGIDLELKEDSSSENIPLDHGGCHYVGSTTSLVGGKACTAGGGSLGSLGARAYVEDVDDHRMVTAGHLWVGGEESCADSTIEGEDLYINGELRGTVDSASASEDYALIKNGAYTTGDLTNNVYYNSEELPIAGSATNYEYMMSGPTPTTTWATGTTTGTTNGFITEIQATNGSGCVYSGDHGITVDNRGAEGDSGGPVFIRTNDGNSAAIVTITSYGEKTNRTADCGSGRTIARNIKGMQSDRYTDYGIEFGQ